MAEISRELTAECAPILRIAEEELGPKLAALYLYGSAVTGGLRYDSDLDFLAVTGSGLRPAERKTLTDRLLRASGRWPRTGAARPVELTVVARAALDTPGFPPRAEFVYGEWLRADLELGHLPEPVHDPDLTILIAMARQSSWALYGPPAHRLFAPVPSGDIVRAIAASLPALLDGMAGDERNTVLTLARMWVTAESGALVSKAEAAHSLAARVPPEYAATLRLARAGYLGQTADDWTDRADEVAAFARYAADRIGSACAGSATP
ncbi:aminoglycoside adenylyltransferase family protein [Nocardia sp. NPDC024068]|uniref:aminoglycoside adenylyltransferase family protein n=1 Tax=Nocardia sp. NPDC024068 TaxID=3157197 RepID=UPI0033D11201